MPPVLIKVRARIFPPRPLTNLLRRDEQRLQSKPPLADARKIAPRANARRMTAEIYDWGGKVSTSQKEGERISGDRIPVAVSDHHVHLSQEVIEQLFCDRYRLHDEFPASQPTQFAAQEFVTLVGPRGRITNVRVIGPPRADNQIEISQTDAQALGIEAPLREPGDLKDTPGILIEGPRTSVRLDHGVIRPRRHIHMNPLEADRNRLQDNDHVDVAKDVAYSHTLCDVPVHVSADYRLELHLDADEGNAAGLQSGDYVVIKAKA